MTAGAVRESGDLVTRATLAGDPASASATAFLEWTDGLMGTKKSARPRCYSGPGEDLAATYSHRTCRPNTIGAAAFHFRVRNGTGWFHRALATRSRASRGSSK